MAKPGEKSAQEQTEMTEKKEADLKAREEALEQKEKKLSARLRDFEATDVSSGKVLTLSEIGQGKGIEMVTDYDPKVAVDMEAFMNEQVTVNVYPDGMPGALDVIVVTVNGTNQPIIRGRDQKIKRKYVEALARSRVTNYVQEVADPTRPENIHMKPLSALTYPFSVREDRNPRGLAWLDAILRQPV